MGNFAPVSTFRERPQDINRKGGPKMPQTVSGKLRTMTREVIDEETGETRGDRIAKKLMQEAETGDKRALEIYFDRVEGKAMQGFGVYNEDGEIEKQQPVVVQFIGGKPQGISEAQQGAQAASEGIQGLIEHKE